MSEVVDSCELLQVRSKVHAGVIDKAYRTLMVVYRPDKGADIRTGQLLKDALGFGSWLE